MSIKTLQVTSWSISLGATFLAFFGWGELYGWKLGSLTAYQYFPLFGLLAFSIMWSHYISAALRIMNSSEKTVLKRYFEYTSLAVLIFLLLHPGLLVWQLWRDGAGLPPASAVNYVEPALKISVISGIIAWIVFLAYEFHRKYGDRQWWRFVGYASDVSMLIIFVHGLRLGSHLQEGWFKNVWYLYGVTLLATLFYLHYMRLTAKHQ
jgi:hypothetical protein